MAFNLGIISLISMIVVILITWKNGGEARASYGMTGFLATIFSLTGLGMGIVNLRKTGIYRFFPIMATIANGLAILLIGFVLYIGRLN